jgi:hypothetical protein
METTSLELILVYLPATSCDPHREVVRLISMEEKRPWGSLLKKYDGVKKKTVDY